MSDTDLMTLASTCASVVSSSDLHHVKHTERKRRSVLPTDNLEVDMDSIRIHPDMLSSFRTPGVFKFRRRLSSEPKIDYFTVYPMPTHVLHTIFSYLNKRDLSSAMCTCRQFYAAGLSAKNWDYLDMYNRALPEDALLSILGRRVKVARLAEANVSTVDRMSSLTLSNPPYFLLTHLDLGRASFSSPTIISRILSGCQRLEGLSLEGHLMDVDGRVGAAIGGNPNLQYLDMSMVRGLAVEDVKSIVNGCRRLYELNMSWCSLDRDSVSYICSNLSDEVTRLNLSGTRDKISITNEDIEMLLTSCPDLEELDLSDNIQLQDTALEAICTLESLQSLSLNRCYGISPPNLLSCGHIRSLNIFGCLTEEGERALKQGLPKTKVNVSMFNYIAKPTPPPNVSSIWQCRTKDIY